MIPKPGKKPKTMKQGKWAKLMDRYVAYIVILRDRRCVTCGRADNLQPGHYLSRTRNSVRWSLVNTHAQCGGCNILHEMNPEPYRRFLVNAYGEHMIDALNLQWSNPNFVLDRETIRNDLWNALIRVLATYMTQPSERMVDRLYAGKATNKEVMELAGGFRNTLYVM